MIVRRFMGVFKSRGITGVVQAIVRRIRTPHARCFQTCVEIVKGATGLEIGGPSPMFSRGGLIPVYPLAKLVDNVNFGCRTIWEGTIKEGDSFTFQGGKAPGKQFIAEAADLRAIRSERYDFILSSHTLEHSANPLRALSEWARVLKAGAGLVLVVPHRDGTFDHRRPVTPLSHLIDDLEAGTDETDLTHLPEILELHDLSMDPGHTDVGTFRARAERNVELRSLHHHVFDTRLAVDAVRRAGFEVMVVEPLRPYHIVVVARKPRDGAAVRPSLEDAARVALQRSPFPTDRHRP